MPRTKRARAKSEDSQNAKKFKRSSSNALDYVTQIQKTLGVKQNTEEDKDTLEEKNTEENGNAFEQKNSKENENKIEQTSTEKNADAIEHISVVSISDGLLSIEQKLCTKLQNITFPASVQYIYNPLEYASETHAMYVHKYCTGVKKILFVGMNPGPWGMSQTGVPFGEISMVRDWLKISGTVGHPSKEHPDRKVVGFQCTRREISGLRLWGLFQELCGSPENFFRHAYMHNYCPLAFMDVKARNITPAELKGEGPNILHEACDRSLIDIIQLLKAEIIVGIGNYAEKRIQTVVQTAGLSVEVMVLRHPSPRAVGNQNWKEIAKQRLEELGLLKYFENCVILQHHVSRLQKKIHFIRIKVTKCTWRNLCCLLLEAERFFGNPSGFDAQDSSATK